VKVSLYLLLRVVLTNYLECRWVLHRDVFPVILFSHYAARVRALQQESGAMDSRADILCLVH